MRLLLLLSAIGLIAAATAPSRAGHVPQPGAAPDSIALERTLCFGTCPAYRLSLRRTGEIHFTSRNPGERLDTADRAGPATLDSLQARAIQARFFSLPDSIDQGSPLCPDYATDHPSLTLTFFARSTKRVYYYTGCYLRSDHTMAPALEALARLAFAFDSATGARRWIHPAPRRRGSGPPRSER